MKTYSRTLADEAYFSGTEQDGSIDLTSTYQDRLTAAFDGTAVNGTLTMNNVAQSFAAPAVSVPAGMYTARAVNDVRDLERGHEWPADDSGPRHRQHDALI